MADVLKGATEWLEGKRKAHLATDAEYRRGEAALAVKVTLERRPYEVTDPTGALVWTTSTDVLVGAADLALAGERLAPRAGDRIAVPTDETVRVLEVMAPGPEMKPFSSDAHGVTLRIHTKQVATEAPA